MVHRHAWGIVVSLTLACPLLCLGVRAEPLPERARLVWASNREAGRHEIYLTTVGSSSIERLTKTGARLPLWSPDGAWIAYLHAADGSVRVMHRDGSEDHQVCTGEPIADEVTIFWMHDGSGLVCREPVVQEGGTTMCYYLTDTSPTRRPALGRGSSFATTSSSGRAS